MASNKNEFEYFCGSNVVIMLEGIPLLEAVACRLSVSESKRPVYGYSSRHFDAVASGQVLVEGSLIINFVDHNYLFRAIELGLKKTNQLKASRASSGSSFAPPARDPSGELRDQLDVPGAGNNLLSSFSQDPGSNQFLLEALKSKYWTPQPNSQGVVPEYVPNPHDAFGGLDIEITFGEREMYNFFHGITSTLIQSLHFTGRGRQIAIDENVILEEYPFFARNISNLVQPYGYNVELNDEFEEESTLHRK